MRLYPAALAPLTSNRPIRIWTNFIFASGKNWLGGDLIDPPGVPDRKGSLRQKKSANWGIQSCVKEQSSRGAGRRLRLAFSLPAPQSVRAHAALANFRAP